MTFRKIVFSLGLATLMAVGSATAATPAGPTDTPITVTKDIQALIKGLDLDITKIDDTTIKVKFMVNGDDELIVISTDSAMDSTLKEALNYKQVDASGLKPYKVYICLLYTSPSPRDQRGSRMPSSA